jgi:hypothetical protein
MSELRQHVSVLAEYVTSDNMEIPESVAAAAKAYAVECQKTNERLVNCDQLLKVHQRAEALRQAQLEPDVLKIYAELDFPNRERWEETALQIGLPVPPRLNAKLARRLNKAYSEAQSTGDMLKQHRWLALARAPLQQRLDVIRLLSKAEPNNLGFSEDVQSYENARFDEMRAVMDDPNLSNNWAIIRALLDDLSAEAWLTPPPLDLVAAVQERHDDMRRKQGERLLRVLNPQLQRVVADNNLEGAEDLAAQAEGVVKDYGIPKKSPLALPLWDTLDWIDSERKRRKKRKQFEAAVEQLRKGLEDGVAWSYVQHYYEVVLEFRMPIPREVTERYAAKARFRMILWILLGLGILTLAAVGVAIYFIAKM